MGVWLARHGPAAAQALLRFCGSLAYEHAPHVGRGGGAATRAVRAELSSGGRARQRRPALAPLTERIGLVGSISTTYSEPYNVARLLASLDHISDGRAAWNVVTSLDPASARNFGGGRFMDKEGRYRRAEVFTRVVKGL